MSHRSQLLLAATAAINLAFLSAVSAAPPASNSAARLATYDKAADQTNFALSLTPPATASAAAHDIVILFDTSASQTGLYRADSLDALKTMLSSLGKQDRVKLLAVDIDAVALTDSFVSPDSQEMASAMAKLNARTPLGSTDMVQALQTANKSFSDAQAKSRAVVYIGDGMSKSQVLGSQKFTAATRELVKNHLPVTSFAIGPERDVQTLAALANQTGGNLYVDTDTDPSAAQFGALLAKAAVTPVYYPTSSKLPAEMTSVYPKIIPPLRADRDSILIGNLKGRNNGQISITAEVDGKKVDLAWAVKPETSNLDLGFLPQLVESAQKDDGATLPTVGSAGLVEAGHVLTANARQLAKLSGAALAAGDKQGAKAAADLALARDPENDQARRIRQVAVQDAPAAEEAPPPPPMPMPAPPVPAPAERVEDDLRLGPPPGEGILVQDENKRRQVQTELIRSEVENTLIDARVRFKSDPRGAVESLKLQLSYVERAPELDPDTRSVLRGKLESAVKEGRRLEIEVAGRQAEREDLRAQAQANERMLDIIERKQEHIKQLMAQFESLMEEGRYREADTDIAEPARKIMDNPTTRAAVVNARFVGNIQRMDDIFERRAKNFIDVLAMVEESHVPFPDEPPIVYPDVKFWERITAARKKYASVDLAKTGSAEADIYAALDAPAAKFDFFETPLLDVVKQLNDEYDGQGGKLKIQFVLDNKALEEATIGTDTQITKSLNGITLRSALKLMLKDHNLAYAIRDEVLVITTKEAIDSNPDYRPTKVYPVADLVLPISSGAQANPFQLGGGIGGQGGFGGGLGGGQQGFGGGGGFNGGGGGFQGGGLGGFQAVADEISLGDKKAPLPTEKPQIVKPVQKPLAPAARMTVVIEKNGSAQEAWDSYYAKHRDIKPESIRETIRQLMKEKKIDEVIAVIQASLKHTQAQPWMYQALCLALQAKGASQTELERALMSAVDFARSPEEMMMVAAHMSRLDMDRRALQIYQTVSEMAPRRPEPYVQGLQVADRLGDISGIQWACTGILRQGWARDEMIYQDNATRTARATLLKLREEGRSQEEKAFQAALNQALVRDCLVKITWTGDADVDLMMEEPGGSICSFSAPRTTAGGVLVGESLTKSQPAEGQSETYVCPEGFAGQYRMLVKRVWGKVTAGKVTVDIYTNYNTDKQKHIRQLVDLNEKDALVMFDVPQGRRKQPLAEQQVANLAKAHQAISRAVLAQQLDAAASQSGALQDYAIALRQAQQQGRWQAPPRRSAVGYRPMITTLPEGANMTATAVISADRRYVRITAVPLFSIIGEVNTFNFSSGAGTTGAGGGTTGGQGGGGVGGVGGF